MKTIKISYKSRIEDEFKIYGYYNVTLNTNEFTNINVAKLTPFTAITVRLYPIECRTVINNEDCESAESENEQTLYVIDNSSQKHNSASRLPIALRADLRVLEADAELKTELSKQQAIVGHEICQGGDLQYEIDQWESGLYGEKQKEHFVNRLRKLLRIEDKLKLQPGNEIDFLLERGYTLSC